MFRQLASVIWVNLSSLGSRPGPSLIIVAGIGGVVAVLVGLLAMSNGFRTVLTETARPDRVLIVRGDSNNEISGWIDTAQLAVIESLPGLAVVSGEIFVTIALQSRDTAMDVDVAARGVTDSAFALRDEVKMVAGRRFRPGTSEIIVGVRAADRYQGLAIGDRLQARTTTWVIVGHFSAQGGAAESEIWVDRSVGQDVFRRQGGVNVVRASLGPDIDAEGLAARIEADPRLELAVIAEPAFFENQSASRAALINTFAYFIAGIMALGAVLAALNTMYVTVGRRTREIAVLRTLGFGSAAVIGGILVEALLLALVGGLLGACVVYLMLDGLAATTFNGASSTQVAFAFRVTPHLAATGLGWALCLGLLGGFLPALRAARMPLVGALRGA